MAMTLPNMRAARVAKQLSVSELSYKVMVSAAMISNIERGGNTTLRTATAIAKALGTTVEALKGEKS